MRTSTHKRYTLPASALLVVSIVLMLTTPSRICSGQVKSSVKDTSPVEMEMMTWPELKRAIHSQGKTTVLVYNGGTEQRGPQAITAGHTFIARALARQIAIKLGNALVAPVLPYSVNNASKDLPGTIGISGTLFAAMNEEIAEQLIVNGFKNVVLMGDHGGGQKELAEVAHKLDAKYAGKGIRVVYCDDIYWKAGEDFGDWLQQHGYPVGTHASIMDTSEMLYLGNGQNWVRKELLPTALGDPEPASDDLLDSDPASVLQLPNKPARKPINNGIIGDARRSSVEIGRRISQLKVDYAVAQIRRLLNTSQR